MAYVPKIGAVGVWALDDPFSAKLIPNAPYECVAVRRLVDIIAAGGDPKKTYYLDNELSAEDFAEDAAGNVCIVTLQHGALSTVYVPSSYITGIPATGGVPYTQLLLAVDLGAVPNRLDLTSVCNHMKQVVADDLGLANRTVHIVAASPTTIVSDENHETFELARQAAVETDKSLRAQLSQALATIADLQTKNAQLVAFIEDLDLPETP